MFQFHEFFKSSGFQLQSLYEHRIVITTSLNSSNLPNTPPVLSAVERFTSHVRAFGKFFRRLQQLETARFVLLPICTDIVLYYWSKVVQSTEVSPELINGTPLRITVSCLFVFAEISYRYPVRRFSASDACTGDGSFPRKPQGMDSCTERWHREREWYAVTQIRLQRSSTCA